MVPITPFRPTRFTSVRLAKKYATMRCSSIRDINNTSCGSLNVSKPMPVTVTSNMSRGAGKRRCRDGVSVDVMGDAAVAALVSS